MIAYAVNKVSHLIIVKALLEMLNPRVSETRILLYQSGPGCRLEIVAQKLCRHKAG